MAHGSSICSVRISLFAKTWQLVWKLARQDEIYVQWQCCPDRNPQAFAPMAQEDDDGKRVGIRAFKIVDGVEREHWIVRDTPDAVLLANTLHDFLNGQIVEKDYK